MKTIRVRANWPIDHDPNEGEIIIHATLHDGERRTMHFDGSAPWTELHTVVGLTTGEEIDTADLPQSVQDALMERAEEWIKERAEG
jgi:hypothetical protein